MHYAAEHGNADIVELLLAHKADPNKQDYQGIAALHFACSWYQNNKPYRKVVKLLLKNGANPNLPTNRGESPFKGDSPFYLAIEKGHVDLAELLLKYGAAIDKIIGNYSALVIACGRRRVKSSAKMVELLLQTGGDPNKLDSDGYTPLYYAIRSNRADLVELLLDHGAKLDIVFPHDGSTVLFHACGGTGIPPNLKIIKLLLQYKPDLNCSDRHGNTVLHWVVRENHINVVKLLLKVKGSPPLDINKKTNKGNTALHIASGVLTTSKPNPEMVKLLLEDGADPKIKNNKGQTVLTIAKEHNDIDVIAHLSEWAPEFLESKIYTEDILNILANPQIYTAQFDNLRKFFSLDKDFKMTHIFEPAVVTAGEAALALAAENGNNEGVKLLLSHGIKPHGLNNSPICLAAQKGHIEVVKTLLKNGADPNFTSAFCKYVPLHYAAEHGNANIVELLLAHKADPNKQDNQGVTALHFACCWYLQNNKRYRKVVKLLLKNGANPNLLTNKGESPFKGESPLYFAIRGGHVDLAELLLKYGAAIDKIIGNYSALLIVCGGTTVKSSAKMVELLLQRGANPNSVVQEGYTPLYYAIRENRADIVELLLDYGANPNLKDEQGKTPLAIAQEQDNIDIITTLLQYKADL